MRSEIVELSVENLLNPDALYRIPTYQRNYAWGEGEISQLLQDIIDFRKNSNASSYYLGTLVVYERKEKGNIIYETIDGQQRLTTLSLLSFVLKRKDKNRFFSNMTRPNLEFESRPASTEAINFIFENASPSRKEINQNIYKGYETIERVLELKLMEHDQSLDDFYYTLAEKVKILRVPVPENTDLNHYFEVMNNRGEQLEKHEVLKAELLEVFEDLPEAEEREVNRECFNLIWEACSNMEKYAQYGFSKDQREVLFGSSNWDQLQFKNFDEICQSLKTSLKKGTWEKQIALSEIIGNISPVLKDSPEDEEGSERFNTVINYENFLLHVLRVQTRNGKISLDDKKLIDHFRQQKENALSSLQFVKDFAFSLLKCKHLFDKYVIKREFLNGKDNWSLKKVKFYPDSSPGYVNTFGSDEKESTNRNILMLLAMFHVSAPTLVYKYWLSGVLDFLYHSTDEISHIIYENYLFELAKAFVFDRFLAENPKEYEEIIYLNNGKSNSLKDDLDFKNLRFDRIRNNLVFNFLDFILWRELKDNEVNWSKNIDISKLRNFEFTFRSSVEHYYPQNPMHGHRRMDKKHLHSFGNLCLISHSKNSRLSNLPPSAKESHYSKDLMDSVKQHLMMTAYGDPSDWNEEKIEKHRLDMEKTLQNQMIRRSV